jgi:biopolymer transport protein TolR
VARHRRRELALNSEINVVSLIDVILLLLVIFMITAPMMQGGVDVALPKADAKPLDQPKSGLVVSVDRAGAIWVDQTKMTLPEFRASFRALASNRVRDGVYLRGDAGVSYGIVTQVLAVMRAAGVGDVGLVTDPESAP